MKLNKLFRIGITFALISFFAGSSSASSPDGPAPKDAQQAFDWCDVVFSGKVVGVRKDKLGFDSIAAVEIDQIWKGKGLPKQVEVDGRGGPTYSARVFTIGQDAIFYVDYVDPKTVPSRVYGERTARPESVYPWGPLRADSFLHRVAVIGKDKSKEDLQFLSKKSSSRPSQ